MTKDNHSPMIKPSSSPISRLAGIISRRTGAYVNQAFKQYDLGGGTYPFLLALHHNEGMNQNQLSHELSVDKAMTARTLQKLISTGYVYRIEDPDDSRAFKLYLTDKGKSIVPELLKILVDWNKILTQTLSPEETQILAALLLRVADSTGSC